MQLMERAGSTIEVIRAWLADQGVMVGKSAVHRCLDRIRAAAAPPAPEVPVPGAELEPASDDDELRLLRSHFWKQARDPAESARDQQGAARLLLSMRAEKRAAMGAKPPTNQPPAVDPQKPPDSVVFN